MIVVYKIILNNKEYIGSTINYKIRRSHHIGRLKANGHGNRHLQRAYNKYKNLKFEIIEECIKDNIIEREQHYIDTLKPYYNIRKIADSCLGVKRSKQTRDKISKALMGKPLKQSHKDAIAKPIVQYTKNNMQVNKFKSTTLASEETKISRTAIKNCLKGRAKTSGGYIWKYESEVVIA